MIQVGLGIRTWAVLWTSLFPIAAFGQQKTDKSPATTRISGTVIDDCGAEVRYASVLLFPAGSAIPQSTTRADDEGAFLFVGLAPSSYDLQVTAPGYRPVVTGANASQGDVSVTVRMDGLPVCPSASPRVKYLRSPMPQTLDSPPLWRLPHSARYSLRLGSNREPG